MANRIQMTYKAAELVLQQAPELKPHIAARRRQETTAAGVSGTVRTYWLDVYPVGSSTLFCLPCSTLHANLTAAIVRILTLGCGAAARTSHNGIKQSINGTFC